MTNAKTADQLNLLTPAGTAHADGADEFDASERFYKGEVDDVTIGYVNYNFRRYFQVKTERNVESVGLMAYDLDELVQNPKTLTGLSDKATSKTCLAHLWSLLKNQGDGNDDGPLLVNGDGNIFYISDAEGTLWAVRARWGSSYLGWNIRACSLKHLYEWFTGRRVFL